MTKKMIQCERFICATLKFGEKGAAISVRASVHRTPALFFRRANMFVHSQRCREGAAGEKFIGAERTMSRRNTRQRLPDAEKVCCDTTFQKCRRNYVPICGSSHETVCDSNVTGCKRRCSEIAAGVITPRSI